ncbi:hypothetical protein MBUL_03191 [Methylobacterium bullatum]|uniref:Uncharacterized protein n=1 Tax=Methylobacterium bullatum TaxID=570505 RepID=A0A679IZP3_9HYPH|nr:hypothetical protein MBUL_03191 [Methylobacterium bullatum]
MYKVVISEWIARIPGLFWLQGADKLRRINPALIERKSRGWRTYKPRGKSGKVLGGIGTVRLPQAEDGYRLVTMSAGHNASSGAPVLVAPEVWEHHRLREGSVIVNGSARWRDMPQKWAALFPVVSDIPRGCLVLDKVDDVDGVEQGAPVQIHPFSIMEYWQDNVQLHDFVYATADSADSDFRCGISRFFEDYRHDRGREGSYLTSADIANPMWDALFANPEDMRFRKAAQLRLIERRVAEAARGEDVVDALLRMLSNVQEATVLKRLSEKSGIPWRRWSQGGSIAEEAGRLVDRAIETERQQALLYAAQFEFA